MKKLFPTFCLSALLLCGLSACGTDSADPSTTTPANTTPDSSTADSATPEADNTTFPALEDYEVLRVGIDLKYYPFMYLDDSGEPAGLEPAISHAFGEYLGIPVEIVNTDFSMLIPALDTGDVDIVISDMSSNESRLEKADFSDSYRYGHTLALVNRDFAEANNVTDDMSSAEFFALEGARYVGLSGTIAVTIPLDQGIEVDEVLEVANAVLDVSRGTYDVIVGGDTIRGDNAANPDTTVIYEGIEDYTGSRFVVKKGNDVLIEQANLFIPTMAEAGGLFEQIGTSMDAEIGEFLQDDSLGLSYIVTPPN